MTDIFPSHVLPLHNLIDGRMESNINFLTVICGLACLILALSYVEAEVYSEKERNALDQFRPMVISSVPPGKEDAVEKFLIRFLRAKNLNLKDAKDMLQKYQKWRTTSEIDNILNETILEFDPLPYMIQGKGLKGSPLLIFTPTHIDLRRLVVQGLRDKVLRYFWQMLEKQDIAVRDAGEDTAIAILDLHGFNIRQHGCLGCVQLYLDWFRSLEQYYPGALKYLIIINTPRIALPVIELVRPILLPSTSAGLKIFPPDKEKWTAFLKTVAAPDQLPFRLGGSAPN